MMMKLIAGVGVAAMLATASVGTSAPAEAHGAGPAIIGGIIGGIALGSIIAAQRDAYYDDYPGYYGYPGYYRYHYYRPYYGYHTYGHPYRWYGGYHHHHHW